MLLSLGDFGNLVAVAADPIADITELERVRFVIKDGQVIRNNLRRIETQAVVDLSKLRRAGE